MTIELTFCEIALVPDIAVAARLRTMCVCVWLRNHLAHSHTADTEAHCNLLEHTIPQRPSKCSMCVCDCGIIVRTITLQTLQCTATYCDTLQRSGRCICAPTAWTRHVLANGYLQHSATHFGCLQLTTTPPCAMVAVHHLYKHMQALNDAARTHTPTPARTHTPTHSNSLVHTASWQLRTLSYVHVLCDRELMTIVAILQQNATHCNLLVHTAPWQLRTCPMCVYCVSAKWSRARWSTCCVEALCALAPPSLPPGVCVCVCIVMRMGPSFLPPCMFFVCGHVCVHVCVCHIESTPKISPKEPWIPEKETYISAFTWWSARASLFAAMEQIECWDWL